MANQKLRKRGCNLPITRRKRQIQWPKREGRFQKRSNCSTNTPEWTGYAFEATEVTLNEQNNHSQ
ncbi:unnamed protein product [Arabidopsis halleri]